MSAAPHQIKFATDAGTTEAADCKNITCLADDKVAMRMHVGCEPLHP